MPDTLYNNGIFPEDISDIESSFSIEGNISDEFDYTMVRADSYVSALITDDADQIYVNDITEFYPASLPGPPGEGDPWARMVLHIPHTGEIIISKSFEFLDPIDGNKGIINVATIDSQLARGVFGTIAQEIPEGSKIFNYVSAGSVTLIQAAIRKIEDQIHSILDYTSGHDHSDEFKGRPIPSDGIEDNAITTSKYDEESIIPSKLLISGTPDSSSIVGYDGSGGFIWKTQQGGLNRGSFVSGDLTSGKLLVTHNLAVVSVDVTIFDNNSMEIIPCDIRIVNTNSVEIDLTSFTITGSWRYLITG